MRPLVSIPCSDYDASVAEALHACGAGPVLACQRRVLLKPNLVNASPPPVTTPAAFTLAVGRFVRAHAPNAEIIIGEGTGDMAHETGELFALHGYAEVAGQLGARLVDLNRDEPTRSRREGCRMLAELRLPRLAMESFLISLPVLKAHSLAGITGSLKNLVGLLSPADFGGPGGWKKSRIHHHMQAGLADLAAHRAPDLAVMDATRGLADYHLGGAELDPPPGRILAGFDPWALDREAARLLGLDWRSIGHLRGPD